MGPELGARDGEFFNIDLTDYPSSLVLTSSMLAIRPTVMGVLVVPPLIASCVND